MDIRVVNILKLVGVDEGSVKPKSSQQNAMLKEVVARKAPQLLESANDGEVAQWLSFAATAGGAGDVAVNTVNDWLAMRSYMAGFQLSIADVAVFEALSVSAASWDVAKVPHVARWYAHVQTQCSNGSAAAAVALPAQDPLSFPVFKAPVAAASSSSSSGGGDGKKGGDKPKKDKGAAPAAVPAAASAAADDAGDPSKIAFVVGKVVKCWNHEESDKLLCEEVDLGEEKTRMIASGIRAFYTADQVEGRMVVVAANLKPRKIANFASAGMVLCAVNADHSAVALLEPPAGAEPGQTVTFEGFAGEPATPAQVAKKKLLEKILPGLKTDADGNCCYNASMFALPTGVCTAKSMPSSMIS